MSHGTYFTTEIYLPGRRYDTIADLEEDIDHERNLLNKYWDEALALMAATPAPQSYESDDMLSGPEYVVNRYHELRDLITDQTNLLANLLALKENFATREAE